jgi:NADPH:quinone reductase-like Zn-dependent oxidoreductase
MLMSPFAKICATALGLALLAVATLALAVSHNAACGTGPRIATTRPMRAAVHYCYGSAEVVRIESIARPVPAEHGVLVRVRASSVNPLDWHTMRGEPYVMRPTSGWGAPNDESLGTDFAGTVEAVGKRVTRFKPGDEVFGGGTGAFAQYLRIPENAVVALKPADLSFEDAAAAPVAGITALQALRDQGSLRAGQKVLINGAGGGVGTFAVQIAKAAGAEVTAVTNTASLALARSIGADHVIDYSHEDFTQGAARYDLILDLSGNHPLSAYRRVMSPTATYVLAGDTGNGSWVGPLAAFGKAALVARFTEQKLRPFLAQMNQADLTLLAAMLETGKVKPVVDRRYNLERIADAIRYQESGHARGKVVVTID